MKLMILLTFVMLQAHAEGVSQSVTFSGKDVPLKKVFNEIEKQTGYVVFYNKEQLASARPVSLAVRDIPLPGFLEMLLKDQPLNFRIDGKDIILSRKAPAPPPALLAYAEPAPPIRGRVLTEDGTPLPGASVKIKGATTGTSTDSSGVFILNARAGQTLVITFVGYKEREYKVGSEQNITIVLAAEESRLDEVVVVGYGAQKKSVITSSVSTINQEAIRNTPGANIQNMLTGKVSGYFSQQRTGQPGAETTEISIRGVATYNSGTNPLVLVDDIEYNFGQFKLISADEIASISILKDAEATAIYGVKGANGVILVKTKRGKASKAQIEIRTEAGLQIPIRTFQTLGSYDVALLTNEALANDGGTAMFSERDLELFKSGEDPYGHPDVDWYNTLFRKTAPMTETNVNISGGSNRVRYFLSGGYQYMDGLLKNIDYRGREPEPNTSKVNKNYYSKRYKFRSNLDVSPTQTTTISFDITGTYHEVNAPQNNVFTSIFKYDYVRPYGYPVYNPDGSFGFGNPAIFQPAGNINNPAALSALGGYHRSYNNFINMSLVGSQKLDMILPGLSTKVSATFSYANNAERWQDRAGIPAYFYNPADSSYTPRDQSIYRINQYVMTYNGSVAGSPNSRLNIQAHLAYNKKFSGGHNVNALLLYNQTSYYAGADLPFNFLGYTYRFGYNYKERYIFSASGAYNGSDRFVTQNRFNLFPAFAVAWNGHNEDFVRDKLPFLTQFKLRASYGIVGNDNIGINEYFFENKYERSGNYYFGELPNQRTGIREGDIGNNDVSWESERKWNFGIDLGLFQNKLTITADYFDNYRYDILSQRQTLQRIFGMPTSVLPYVNLGEVKNHGYELEIGYNGNVGKLGYTVRTMVTYAKNKVIYRDDPPALYPWQDRTGLPIGVQRQYIWDGEFYTTADLQDSKVAKPVGTVRPGYLKYRDMNGDGIINVDDMAYLDRANRQTTVLSFTLGFQYEGFSISALFQAGLGGYAYVGYEAAVPFKAALQPTHLNRWTPETAETATFPALSYNFVGTYMNPNGNLSTFWTESSDYLRLRSIEFGYTFKKSVTNRLKLSNLRAFANAYNLVTWSKFYKKYQYDPEVANEQNDYIYPVTSNVNFGLTIGL
ncbi:MAG: TonB-dependent receptor [Candidatus Pseudobacter hemicellulosilyticus]|uniref:TonB-dependent receptor n=1 Tax=Candidatus Pseudobacter hemicellulosilyticus TaxID=3121375 RepID=A0AAJ5WQK4_9BACT|nr:MAG: TonB-dependent receptor [Pseudobacter sp.]